VQLAANTARDSPASHRNRTVHRLRACRLRYRHLRALQRRSRAAGAGATPPAPNPSAWGWRALLGARGCSRFRTAALCVWCVLRCNLLSVAENVTSAINVQTRQFQAVSSPQRPAAFARAVRPSRQRIVTTKPAAGVAAAAEIDTR